MSNDKLSMDDVRSALNNPSVKKSTAEKIIPNMMSALNIGDLEPVSEEDSQEVLNTYFQGIVLETDEWTCMPGVAGSEYVQIAPFKLKTLPEGTHLVADVLIDKSEYEVECFEKYITNMEVRDKSVVFTAVGAIPIKITLGLKCVNVEGAPVRPEPEHFVKKRG